MQSLNLSFWSCSLRHNRIFFSPTNFLRMILYSYLPCSWVTIFVGWTFLFVSFMLRLTCWWCNTRRDRKRKPASFEWTFSRGRLTSDIQLFLRTLLVQTDWSSQSTISFPFSSLFCYLPWERCSILVHRLSQPSHVADNLFCHAASLSSYCQGQCQARHHHQYLLQ